jgi:hypothetical protein
MITNNHHAFANISRENRWSIKTNNYEIISFEDAWQAFYDIGPPTDKNLTFDDYIVEMSAVMDSYGWKICNVFNESSELYNLIEYYICVNKYGFENVNEPQLQSDESDEESYYESDNDNDNDDSAPITQNNNSGDEVVPEAPNDPFTSSIENIPITNEDWDEIAEQLNFDLEEEGDN